MPKHTETIWPPLETAYTDEFGEIDPEVYAVAGRLWRQGERRALSALGDSPAGLRLMLKAVAIVSRKQAASENLIANLSAYLFQTYKRLILTELERENGHRQHERDRQPEIESLSVSLAEDLDRKILVQQIIQRMEGWMREVFELLALGYSFEEIGKIRNQNGHALRTKFNRHLRELAKKIRADN